MLDKIKSAFKKKKDVPENEGKDTLVSEVQKENVVKPLKGELQEKLVEYKALILRLRDGETELSEDLVVLQKEMTGLRERISGLVPLEPKEKAGEGFDLINKALEALSAAGEIVYHSPRKINEKLKEVGSSLSEHEILRMEGEFGKLSLEQVKSKCKLLKEHTEGKKAPLFLILPREIVIADKTIPFTIGNLDQDNAEGIWKHWKEKKSDLKGFYVDHDYVSAELQQKQWGDHAVAFTTSSLEGSKNKTYEEQKQYVKEKLGERSEIKGDMYPAMILHYLLTGELLIDYNTGGWMRLHELGTDGDPLSVIYDVDKLKLDSRDTREYASAGIGSAFVFSL